VTARVSTAVDNGSSGMNVYFIHSFFNRLPSVRHDPYGNRNIREGQNIIYALANQLDKEGFWSRMQFASEGRVTAILFAHPDLLAYLQAYPDILRLNCTYKTNKLAETLKYLRAKSPDQSFTFLVEIQRRTPNDAVSCVDRL
jgi:hypothetical protein